VCYTKLRLQILVMHFSLVLASLATLSWLMLHSVEMEGAVFAGDKIEKSEIGWARGAYG